jgi:hypothetical protein
MDERTKYREALTQVKVDHLNRVIQLPIKTHALVENALAGPYGSEGNAKPNFGSAPPSSAAPPRALPPVCTCSYEDSEEMTGHAGLCAITKAALNQCDGCIAGKPLDENGNHRMGEGAYPDLMGCQKYRYEPEPGQTVRSELQDFHDHAIDQGFHECEGIPGGCPVENMLRAPVVPERVVRLTCRFPGERGLFHLYLPVRDGFLFHAPRLAGVWPTLTVSWPKLGRTVTGSLEWNEESQSVFVDWDDGDTTEVDLKNGTELKAERKLTFTSLRHKGEKTQFAVLEVSPL